ncbi:hypothetical protein NQ315_011950, partial [Exocentrus adspersus]
KPIHFSENVLIGNWVEQRSSYIRNQFKHRSIYSEEYVQKPFDVDTSNVVCDQKIKAEAGHGIIPPNASNEPFSFYENFSTLYDLSYKYFPKWYGKAVTKNLRSGVYDSKQEYIRSYGNLSNFGLCDHKKHEWKCDTQDPRTTVFTTYEDACRGTLKKGNHPSLPTCNVITWECKTT